METLCAQIRQQMDKLKQQTATTAEREAQTLQAWLRLPASQEYLTNRIAVCEQNLINQIAQIKTDEPRADNPHYIVKLEGIDLYEWYNLTVSCETGKYITSQTACGLVRDHLQQKYPQHIQFSCRTNLQTQVHATIDLTKF